MSAAESHGIQSRVMLSEELRQKYRRLHQKAKEVGLTSDDFEKLDSLKEIAEASPKKTLIYLYLFRFFSVIFAFYITILMIWCLDWPIKNDKLLSVYFRLQGFTQDDVYREPCVLESGDHFQDAFRPPIACDFCRDVKRVERVSKITPEEFEEKFAYSGRPVVITDGMKNWTATDHFSYMFFKNIYKPGSPALENSESNCQFFPYKTAFKNLGEVFEMDDERAHMQHGAKPWYIGWSNCDVSAGSILREHYERPYFLPPIAESSKTDWIFMGSPGYGAHMHVDNVGQPSWQAQVTGTKKWTLEAPPECYLECVTSMDVTVKPGEIIVLDTNWWFHSTLNVGDDISITIGSEYD